MENLSFLKRAQIASRLDRGLGRLAHTDSHIDKPWGHPTGSGMNDCPGSPLGSAPYDSYISGPFTNPFKGGPDLAKSFVVKHIMAPRRDSVLSMFLIFFAQLVPDNDSC